MDFNTESLLPFDPAILPWKTIPDDWALCIVPEPECRVWVEHALIRAMLEADFMNPDDVANIHGMFTTIGGKVAALLDRPGCVVHDGQVWAIKLEGNPVGMRMGRFGGEAFVFLPRPEFEGSSEGNVDPGLRPAS